MKQLPNLERLLVATDFSDASRTAFRTALRLCLSLKASLCILHVFEYTDYSPPEAGGELLNLGRFLEECQEFLNCLVVEASSAGVVCKGLVRSGSPHTTILDAIISEKIDLAVLGTRSFHGFERLVFGSTAEAVLRKATCPVLTIGPQAAVRSKLTQSAGGIVMFATDFHVTTTEAVRYAASFSRLFNLPLHCLHVLPRALEDEAHQGVVPIIIHEALEHLAVGVDTGTAKPVFAVTYGSEVSNAIVEYGKQHDARLLVLGVRRASFVASHVTAHIAFRVITEAPCPVLTMTLPLPSDRTVVASQEVLPTLVSA